MFRGVPNFAPEILRRVRLDDAMKAKKLKEALHQMAEEGVVQLFSPEDGSPAIVGVVGALQLDVLKERLSSEYTLPVSFEMSRFSVCRWISAEDPLELDKFVDGATRRHRPRPRRRPGVPGAGFLFAALRVRALSGDQDGRDQGVSRRQGGVITIGA